MSKMMGIKYFLYQVWFSGSSWQRIALMLFGFLIGVLVAAPIFPAPSFVYEFQTLIGALIALFAAMIGLHVALLDRARTEYAKERGELAKIQQVLDTIMAGGSGFDDIVLPVDQLVAMPTSAKKFLHKISFMAFFATAGAESKFGTAGKAEDENYRDCQRHVSHFRDWVTKCEESRLYNEFLPLPDLEKSWRAVITSTMGPPQPPVGPNKPQAA